MMRPPLSVAAAGLLRALLARAGVDRQRVLLAHFRSEEWHSNTLSGERHEIELRVTGRDAPDIARRLIDGIEEADFAVPRQIVADIAVTRPPEGEDGITSLALEALTIAE